MLRIVSLGVLIMLLGAASLPAQPQQRSLEDLVEEYSVHMAEVLHEQKVKTVSLELFDSLGLPSSGLTLLSELLVPNLERQGISIVPTGADAAVRGYLRITGRFAHPDRFVDDGRYPVAFRPVAKFTKPAGQPDLKLPSFDVSLIHAARLVGAPFDLSSHEGNDIVLPELRELRQPIDQSIVRAKDGSPFGIVILHDGQPVGPKWGSGAEHNDPIAEGLAFVELTRDQRFSVRLVNDADFEVAVKLTVDGLDSAWFSGRNVKLWLVKPHSFVDVSGWQLDNDQSELFSTAPFRDSVAARHAELRRDLGVVAASFSRVYPTDAEYDAHDQRDLAKTDPTWRLRRVDKFPHKLGDPERKLGYIRANVPVRFDVK